MSPEQWAAYLVAASIVLVIPGPTILLVISYAISHGRSTALKSVIGVVMGDFTAMSLSLAGLGAVLAASAQLFSVLKIIGAAYLAYLGIKMWLKEPHPAVELEQSAGGKTVIGHAFLVTVLNPKSIMFFVAFLPQFMNPHAPFAEQAVPMGIVFLVMAAINAATYAMLGGYARNWFRTRRAALFFNRLGGSALIGAAVMTAALKRAR